VFSVTHLFFVLYDVWASRFRPNNGIFFTRVVFLNSYVRTNEMLMTFCLKKTFFVVINKRVRLMRGQMISRWFYRVIIIYIIISFILISEQQQASTRPTRYVCLSFRKTHTKYHSCKICVWWTSLNKYVEYARRSYREPYYNWTFGRSESVII